MTVSYLLNGIRFEWDSRKASSNIRNHGVNFETACEVFFDPLVHMKINDLKKRLKKDRPKTAISLNLPDDVIADLQRIAPLRGCSDYRALMRAYIGQGLRADLERFEGSPGVSVCLHREFTTARR
jgi:hypothetical protein